MDSTLELISAAFNLAFDWMGFDGGRKPVVDGLSAACELGNLKLVKRIAEGFHITSDEVEVIRQALLAACRSDNLDIVIWLKDRYSLTVADALKVLERCCNSRGVKCLTEAFGLSEDDTREALKKACEFGNHSMVMCLLSNFVFPEDAIAEARALVDGNKAIVDTLDGVLSGKPSY